MQNAPAHPGPFRVVAGKVPHYLNAINISESLFAMPFGYIGMVLASHVSGGSGWPGWHAFIWITLAFVGVRTLGMSANRIINAREDARNPRTAGRHIPAGILKPLEVAAMAGAGAAVFFVAAWQLNPLALMLSPVAAAYVVLYSFAKYFTWLCSLMLGLALSIAPSGAWIGVTGELAWQPVLLTFAVMMWAGGFETIYGSMDFDFDRANRINSIASRFGVRNAIRTTRVLHTLAAAALLVPGHLDGNERVLFHRLGSSRDIADLRKQPGEVRPAGHGGQGVCVQQVHFHPIAGLHDPRGGAALRWFLPVVAEAMT